MFNLEAACRRDKQRMTKEMSSKGAGELEKPVEDPRGQSRDKEVATWNKTAGKQISPGRL
jgi:hypothetical protein